MRKLLLLVCVAMAPMPALARIKGIGPSKLGRYGEEILEITRAER